MRRFRGASGAVLGTWINALTAGGVLLGTMWGRRPGSPVSSAHQSRLRWLSAGLALVIGGSGIARAMPHKASGAFQWLAVAFLGLILGNLTGRILGLQRRLDTWARSLSLGPRQGAEVDTTIRDTSTLGLLLALSPLLIPASIQEGLEGRWLGLALKSVLDGAALWSWHGSLSPGNRSLSPGRIARLLGPAVVWQAIWTAGPAAAAGWLRFHGLSDPLMLASNLLILCCTPALAGIPRTPQANLLPTLLWIPILAPWLRG